MSTPTPAVNSMTGSIRPKSIITLPRSLSLKRAVLPRLMADMLNSLDRRNCV